MERQKEGILPIVEHSMLGLVSAIIFIALSVVSIFIVASITFYIRRGGHHMISPLPLAALLIPICEEFIRILVIRSKIISNQFRLLSFTFFILIFELFPKFIGHVNYESFRQISIFIALATPPSLVHYICGQIDFRSKSKGAGHAISAFALSSFIHITQYLYATHSGDGKLYAAVAPTLLIAAIVVLHWRQINVALGRFHPAPEH